MMVPVWILIFLSYKTCPVQTTEIVNQAVLNEARISITLNCTFKAPSNKDDDIACIWYKQTLKKEPQQVGTAKIKKVGLISSPFNNSRFILKWSNDTTNSLTILNLTEEDEGTYFCGVAEKSEVHFSSVTFVAVTGHRELNQTKTDNRRRGLDTLKNSHLNCSAVKPVGPVVICLGAVLGVCVAVIIAQAIIICKMKNSEHGNARPQQGSVMDKTTNERHDAEELNYAAIHFNERKTKRGQVKRGQPEDSMYSEVKRSAPTDYHLDY